MECSFHKIKKVSGADESKVNRGLTCHLRPARGDEQVYRQLPHIARAHDRDLLEKGSVLKLRTRHHERG